MENWELVVPANIECYPNSIIPFLFSSFQNSESRVLSPPSDFRLSPPDFPLPHLLFNTSKDTRDLNYNIKDKTPVPVPANDAGDVKDVYYNQPPAIQYYVCPAFLPVASQLPRKCF